MIPTVIALGVSLVKKQAAQALLMLALTVGTKALTAILKEAGQRARDSLAKAADQFGEKAQHNAELAAAELDAKKRLWLETIAAMERGAEAGLRELLAQVEQNADEAAVQTIAAKIAGTLKELAARRRRPPAVE